MATYTFTCAFGCGAIETVLAGHSHWRQTGTVPVCTFVAGQSPQGLNVLQWSPAAAQQAAYHTRPGNTPTLALGFDMKVVTPPDASVGIAQHGRGGVDNMLWWYDQPSAKYYPAYGSNTAPTLVGSGIALTTGQWYHISMLFDISANPSTLDVSVDGIAQAQASNPVLSNADSLSTYGFGQPSAGPASVTGTIQFANFTESVTSGDHPLPPVAGHYAWPNADGTHTFTGTNAATGVTATPVGTAITSARTDCYQWVDGPDMGNSADFWNQTANSTTQYGEVVFPDAPYGAAPLAVTFHGTVSAVTTSAANQSGRTIDTATELSLWSDSPAVAHPSMLPRSVTRILNSAGGAWTRQNYNDIKFRWGYSSDANPDVYLNNIIIESIWPLPPAKPIFQRPWRRNIVRSMR